MKRLVSLACILCLLLMCAAPAFAGGTAVLNGEAAYVKRGGYVEYSVRIQNNPGISAFLVYLDFDTALFSAEFDEARGEYPVTVGADFRAGDIHCNVNGGRGYVVSWYSTGRAVAADGVLFTLRLKAADDAASGEYPVTIRYSAKNTLDSGLSPVSLVCQAGSITVAPDAAVLAVAELEVHPGETCSLRVRIDENPGIAAYAVYLLLDTSVFSAIPADDGTGYAIVNGDGIAGSNLLCSAYAKRGYKIQWWNSTENVRAGTLFELPLMVSENAAPGTYAVQLRITAADTTDEHGVPVKAALSDGMITVKAQTWAEVTAKYGSGTVTIGGTPCEAASGDVLMAASYDGSGRLLDCRIVNADAAGQRQSFTLSCPEPGSTTVKFFILDAATKAPLCEAYTLG